MRRLLLPVLVLLPACATFEVTPEEARTLARLESLGLRSTEAGVVPPAVVGLANAWGPLGLVFGPDIGSLPLGGAGNFYLSGRVEAGARAQWWLGVLNSVLWPVSPLWSVPQVVADARILNRKETAFFFTRTARGFSAIATWEMATKGGALEASAPEPARSSRPRAQPSPGAGRPVARPGKKR